MLIIGNGDYLSNWPSNMLIIWLDDIHFPPPKPSVTNILGGAGTYSALGARLLSPPPRSKSIGWVVDVGSDFPHEIRDAINDWDTSCVMRATPERLTTRGWNSYGEGEKRGKSGRSIPATD